MEAVSEEATSSDLLAQAPSLNPSPTMLILSGLIGSGKSTFAKSLVAEYPEWVRCNQDELGSRGAVEAAARKAMGAGKNVIIDRTNIDAKQRRTWLELAAALTEKLGRVVITVSLTFTISTADVEERLRRRTDHETITSTQQAAQILPMFLRSYQRAATQEGFHYTLSVAATSLSLCPSRQEIDEVLFTRLQTLPRAEGVLPVSPPRKHSSRGRGGSAARGGSNRGTNALFLPHHRAAPPPTDVDGEAGPWRRPWSSQHSHTSG